MAKYRYLYAHSYWDVKLKRLAEQTEERTARPASRRETALCDVGELWSADTRGAVKESTYARYRRILSCYIYPSLGAKSPANIDQKCARTYVSDLLLKGGRHGQGLSPKTVSDILCVLKSILKYAAAGGYPCADLSLVKAPPHANKVVSVIPKNYVARIEEAILQSGSEAADFCVRIGVLFALYTGLRIGEMCGLRWGDIDLQNRTVSVRRTVERIY